MHKDEQRAPSYGDTKGRRLRRRGGGGRALFLRDGSQYAFSTYRLWAVQPCTACTLGNPEAGGPHSFLLWPPVPDVDAPTFEFAQAKRRLQQAHFGSPYFPTTPPVAR